ncbi:uncharacterized protein LOC126054167 [Helicoverpa armigera]|uniref:uncharacterized protein LOC126054167 n=1 Tax=Helicoverpa armigera TaxID=29058 RepID=UPI003083E725
MTRSVVLLCVTASLFSSVLCSWEYHSYLEALTDDNTRCLGECLLGQCVYYWSTNIKPCHPTKNETKFYTSYDNYPCQSNCDKFRKGYEWCVTGENQWDYCSRAVALKGRLRHTTQNDYLTCSDECGKHDYPNYDNWCHTIKNYQYCDVDDKIFVPEYPTYDGTTCVTPCMFYDSETETYCYDNYGSWRRCYLNPQYEHVLHSLTRKLRSNCIKKFGNYTSKGYKVCKNLSRSKRYDFSFHECDLDVSAIAERHRAENPSDQVRVIDPHEPITRDTDPILSYTMMPRRVRFGDRNNVANVDLPLVLEAQLTRYTLLPVGADREGFTPYVSNHYNRMNPNRRFTTVNNNYDERGHILASRLGGPMEAFNIFPQTWRLNHGSGSSWFEMEQHMANFLRNRDDRYIEFLAVLGYLRDNNGRLIPRPDHIGIRLRFHQNNILVNRYGNRLNSFEDNETEDMFFSNDPDDDCVVMVANGVL